MARKLGLFLAFVLVAVLSFSAGLITMALHVSQQTPVARAPTSTPLALGPSATPELFITLVPAATSAALPTASTTPTATVTRTPAATPTSITWVTPVSTTAPLSRAATLLGLVNVARQEAGCEHELRWEPRLALIAQAHAEDTGAAGVIDHVGSDGATYQQRLERVGYAFNRRGENIAAGFDDPAEVLNVWLDEPADGPHRTNVLNCAYRDAGVGIAEHKNGYPLWVLDMAEPREP